jgi:DNA-binding transcriptional ArsR family regulator
MMDKSERESRGGIDYRTASRVADLFGALSDATRIRILAALMDGERTVSELAELVGITDSGVSHHLRGLRHMRLVRARKQGRQVHYSLDDEHIADLFRRGLDHVQHG